MSLIIILVCLAVQRYLHLGSYSRQWDWGKHYFAYMQSKFKTITQRHHLIGLLILIVPLLLMTGVVFAIVYHLFSVVGYYILNVLFLWYCIDGRDLLREPYDDVSEQNLFIMSYQQLFSRLFWFVIFGPVGLMLYVSLVNLLNYLQKCDDPSDSLLRFTVKSIAVLDWVPVRLLGLSFALVGHFNATIKIWLQRLKQGIGDEASLAKEFGLSALQNSIGSEVTSEISFSAPVMIENVVSLIERALLVWLVVIAIFTIAQWLG